MPNFKKYSNGLNLLNLRETQIAAYEILKQIDSICRDQGLRYWLAYGTLIGALRHGGFIPWDDDVDICMPRPDYERLLSYFDLYTEDLKPLIAIHNTESTTIPFLITRISDTTYKMIGENGASVPEMGAFVDVYPLDGLGDNYEAARRLKRECFKQMLLYIHSGDFEANRIDARLPKRLAKRIVATILKDPRVYEDKQRKLLSRYEYGDSKYLSVACWGRTDAMEVFRAECFAESVPVQFEDMTSWAPCGYDEILRGFYRDVWGEDYMALPPEEERVPHHTYHLVPRGE